MLKRAWWVLPWLFVVGWVGQDMPSRREVELTHVARLPQIPPGAGEVHLWIPLAKTRPAQRILRRAVQSPVPQHGPVNSLFYPYAEANG